MEKNTRHFIKLFWIWQEERESQWLRDMSLNGWHLQKVISILYTFQRGKPMDLRYYLDFNPVKAKDLPEYREIFEDLGWNLICRSGLRFYFASQSENKIKEVYTDNQSKLKKYGSILLVHVFVISLLIQLSLLVGRRVRENNSLFNNMVALVFFIGLIAVVYSELKFIGLISKLKKDPKE